MVDDSKKMTSSRHNRPDVHELAETLTVCKGLHKFKPDKKIPEWRQEGEVDKNPTLIQEATCN